MGQATLLGAGRLKAGAAVAGDATALFGTSEYNTSGDAASYSGNANFGAAAEAVAVVIQSASAGVQTIDSVTVGGITATRRHLIVNSNAGNFRYCEIWTAPYTAGGSAAVAVTCSGTMNEMIAVPYRLNGFLSLVPTDTGGATVPVGTVWSDVIDVVAGGSVIAGIMSVATTGTHAWTGLTEDLDSIVTHKHSTASANFATTQTGLTVSVDTTGASLALCMAAFR